MTYSGQRKCLNAILMSWFDFLSQASFFLKVGWSQVENVHFKIYHDKFFLCRVCQNLSFPNSLTSRLTFIPALYIHSLFHLKYFLI